MGAQAKDAAGESNGLKAPNAFKQPDEDARSGPDESSGSAAEAQKADRRSFPRHAVNCAATVTLLSGAGKLSGQMVDLSLGGCRLSTAERTMVGILSRVEVCFQLRGMAFRIVGVTAGTRTGKSFGVRFVDMPVRRAAELAELIAEVATAPQAVAPELPARAAEAKPPVAAVSEARLREAVEAQALAAAMPAIEAAAETQAPAAVPDAVTAAPAIKSAANRRAHNRHAVDTRVNLTLVKGAICMPGRILNLSQGGCRLRTDERFNVGIYTRVEAEFYLHGLPFRLAGVSQAIMDRNTIGIRFLDMSARKREHLTELIAEIEEAELNLDEPETLPAADEAGS